MGRELTKGERIDGESAVQRVYDRIKAMAISFELRPGERLNELEIARRIGVSRTPLREALNRLAADRLLDFSPKQGFFRKGLSVKEIADLYDLRAEIERGAVRLAIQRASDRGIERLAACLVEPAEAALMSGEQVMELEERFHEGLAALSGNAEIFQGLKNLNDRIRFVRGVLLETRKEAAMAHHHKIYQAVRDRDAPRAEHLMANHTRLGHDDLVVAVKDAFARIYMA